MEKGGNFGSYIPLPDRATSQINQVRDVAAALAPTGRRALIGDLGVVKGGQFTLGGHTPVGITASLVVPAVALGFSPGSQRVTFISLPSRCSRLISSHPKYLDMTSRSETVAGVKRPYDIFCQLRNMGCCDFRLTRLRGNHSR